MSGLRLAVAAIALFSPAVFAKLEIKNVRACHGRLGPERADLKVMPFDQVFFRYDIVGLDTDKSGEADFSTKVSLTDDKAKVTGGEPYNTKMILAFGGDRMTSFATVWFTPDQKVGKYELKIVVKDNRSGGEASFTRTLELLPTKFAVTSLNFTHDPEGNIPSPAGGPAGHAVFVRFLVVGFDKTKGNIDVLVESRILDDKGAAVIEQPMSNVIKTAVPNDVRNAKTLTVVNSLLLHRPGSYTLDVTISDRNSRAVTGVQVPILVTSADPPAPEK